MTTHRNSFRISAWIAGAILLAAVGLRFYGAALQLQNRDVDCSIVSLMAKEIAEGHELPVFFWGQEYLAVPEAYVAAGFLWVLGDTPWAYQLGSVLMGIAALVLLFRWGRRLGGFVCAATAVAWIALGPGQFFRYNVRIQAYASIVLLSLLLLHQTAVWIERWRETGDCRRRDLLLIGWLSGLSWWTSSLLVCAIFASALAGLVFFGRRLFRREILFVPVGFFAGSLPWWLWNFRHDFRSLHMAERLNPRGFLTGLRYLWHTAGPDALGRPELGKVLHAPMWVHASVLFVAAICGLALFWFAFSTIRDACRSDRARNAQLPSRVLLLLFLAVSLVIFAASRYGQVGGQGGSTRYLFPALAVFALLLGDAVARAFRAGRVAALAATSALALLIALQSPSLIHEQHYAAVDRDEYTKADALLGQCRRERIDALYVTPVRLWMQLALRGDVCCCFPELRNPRLWMQLEAAEHPAVMEDYADVPVFLHAAGGTAELETGFGALRYWKNFSPPTEGRVEIEPSRWRVHRGEPDGEPLPALSDRSADSALSIPSGEVRTLDIEMAQDTQIQSLRFAYASALPPKAVTVSRWDDSAGCWEERVRDLPLSRGMWCGDRPYWGGVYMWQDLRLPPFHARRIRICLAAHRGQEARITEMQIFGPGGETQRAADGVAPALAHLRAEAPDRIVTDRWLAHRIAERWPDGPTVMSEPYRDDRNAPYDPIIPKRGRTAVVVREEDAPMCAQVLREAGLAVRSLPAQAYVVLMAEATDSALAASRPSLRWAGFGCLLTGP